ncbi:MAG: DUF4426 domain-containing protein [Xanthomonadales bacterium]|nr:DUF4426 domain-containing protein [Xanthomonadales bacterium]
MKSVTLAVALGLLMLSTPASAQQARDFGDYVIHFNALNTELLSPQVAQQYGIRRSSSRAMLNVTVLKKQPDGPGAPVQATLSGTAKNLTGQIRDIEFREIEESAEAIYYIGELSVRNLETFDFRVQVQPAGANETFNLQFRQQFYTE